MSTGTGGVRFVTPDERHRGLDREVLAWRDALYQQARARTPERWSGKRRNWDPVGALMLNPERKQTPLQQAA
ncbi:hypothetical protein GCM10027514_42540 [Azotobacter armeniacus]